MSYVYARTLFTVMFATVYRRIDDQLRREIVQLRDEQEDSTASTASVRNVVLQVAAEAGGPSSVLAHLYRYPPDGFQTAINLAKDLLSRPPHENNATLWSYLACGLGQKFGYLKSKGTVEEQEGTANEAYDAVRKTLELDPSKKAWLTTLWNPNERQLRMGEDDLKPLRDDLKQRARFAELLE